LFDLIFLQGIIMARLITAISGNNLRAEVRWVSEYSEFQVTLMEYVRHDDGTYTIGKPRPESTYYTDDRDDAEGTAKAFISASY
jgi:hypothetical protein